MNINQTLSNIGSFLISGAKSVGQAMGLWKGKTVKPVETKPSQFTQRAENSSIFSKLGRFFGKFLPSVSWKGTTVSKSEMLTPIIPQYVEEVPPGNDEV